MTSFLSKFCGGTLTAALLASTPLPAMAAPVLVVPDIAASSTSNVIDVRHGGPHRNDYIRRPGHRPGGGHGPGWNGNRPPPGWHGNRPPGWHGNRPGYWNGHYGYRYERPGYRYYNGWWYPLAAFGVGAAVGSVIAQPTYRGGGYTSAHYQWCENRYRSYRASDNTFQPYNGPRQQCYSPYD